MRLLALDSSTQTLSCALVEIGDELRVLSESLHEPPAKAGDLLPAALLDLLAHAGLALGDIDGLAVGIGPGSFTGLRVGLAAMKALAYARRVPVAGASSLLALALSARGQVPEDALLVPTIPARKGEIYAGIYRAGAAVAAETVLRADALGEFVRALGEPAFVLGAGSEGQQGAATPALDAPDRTRTAAAPRTPLASAVARACAEELRDARFDKAACFALAPNYLQPSMAEVALREGRVGGVPKTPGRPR